MIGDYQLLRTLGEGTYGVVKLAENRITHNKVALKIASSEHNEKEYEILSSLKHPNILRVSHLLKVPKVLQQKSWHETAMVMELLEGGDLIELLDEGPLGEKQALTFLEQILSAISYCHKRGIAHRDIKPDNLLIDAKTCDIVLCDFGLATRFSANKLFMDKVGSILYCAPELLNGVPYRPSEADVWSVGVVFYCMLTGCVPWEGSNQAEQIENAKQGKWYKPENLSKECCELIDSMLVVDGRQRPTAEQVLNRLAETRRPSKLSSIPTSKSHESMDLEGDDSDISVDGSEDEEDTKIKSTTQNADERHFTFRTISEEELKSALAFRTVQLLEPEVLLKILDWILRSHDIIFKVSDKHKSKHDKHPCLKYRCTQQGHSKFNIEICTQKNGTTVLLGTHRKGDLGHTGFLLLQIFNKCTYL